MNPITITSIVSVCIAFVSVLFVIISFANNKHEHSAEDQEEMKTSLLKCNMKLDQICATTNETRTDIKSTNTKLQDIDKELAMVKRDVKTAFSLIDEIRDDMYK